MKFWHTGPTDPDFVLVGEVTGNTFETGLPAGSYSVKIASLNDAGQGPKVRRWIWR